jgi:hypothetical protein
VWLGEFRPGDQLPSLQDALKTDNQFSQGQWGCYDTNTKSDDHPNENATPVSASGEQQAQIGSSARDHETLSNGTFDRDFIYGYKLILVQ